ncbi:MAG: hypothetical protein R3B83_12760 [Nitrospirales bacterium]
MAQALVKKLEESVFKDKTYKRFVLGVSIGLATADGPKSSVEE